MPAQETLLSIVNAWECDENKNLTEQLYFARFEEADRQFRLATGFSESLVGSRRVRHTRFHQAAGTGNLLRVSSGVCFDGPHILSVLHEMRDHTDGTLIATVVDGYSPAVEAARTLRNRFKDSQEQMTPEATPRVLPATPGTMRTTLAAALSAGATVTHRSTVLSRHLGADGRADDGFAIGCFAEAAPFVWERTPLTQATLSGRSDRRVAIETKLSWAGPLKAGDSIVVASGITGCQANTFSMRHYMFEARTGRPVALCDCVVSPINHVSGTATALSAGEREAILRLKME